ncbi:MAG: tyrosine-type recombinase/integrase [Pseudobdellovibrionaceae bacterium]
MKSLVSPVLNPAIASQPFSEWAAPVIEQFLESLDASELTKSHYQARLQQFALWLDTQPIAPVQRQTILGYKKYLKDRKCEASTIGAYLVAVRQFFQWTDVNRIYPDVTKGIKGAKRGRSFRRSALTISQTHRLLDSIDKTTALGKRDFALINLLVRTGLRTIEITRCKVSDIRPVNSDAVGLWVQGKGRQEADEFVVLTEDCISPIMLYLSDRPSLKQDAPLFASLSDGSYGSGLSTRTIRRVVKERLRAIGLNSPRLTSHSLRHTSISLSLEGGASIQEAQKMARHADISTTNIYVHLGDRAKGIAEKSVENILKRSPR